MTNTRLY